MSRFVAWRNTCPARLPASKRGTQNWTGICKSCPAALPVVPWFGGPVTSAPASCCLQGGGALAEGLGPRRVWHRSAGAACAKRRRVPLWRQRLPLWWAATAGRRQRRQRGCSGAAGAQGYPDRRPARCAGLALLPQRARRQLGCVAHQRARRSGMRLLPCAPCLPTHPASCRCPCPPTAGLGKTTLAHICAAHCGYRPLEINASDDRSGGSLTARVLDAVEMQVRA